MLPVLSTLLGCSAPRPAAPPSWILTGRLGRVSSTRTCFNSASLSVSSPSRSSSSATRSRWTNSPCSPTTSTSAVLPSQGSAGRHSSAATV